MPFSERMKELLEHGWEFSKELALKAGEKAQDLGEKGVIKWEIKQLENKAQKLIFRLGNEAYLAFIDREQNTIDRETFEIRIILQEISLIKEQIERREKGLKNRKAQ